MLKIQTLLLVGGTGGGWVLPYRLSVLLSFVLSHGSVRWSLTPSMSELYLPVVGRDG